MFGKRKGSGFVLLLSLTAWIAPAVVLAGEEIRLSPNDVVEEILGWDQSVVIEGKVVHDVVIIGGSLDVKGEIGGSVLSIQGSVRLRSGSRVEGDVMTLLGCLEKEEESFIGGSLINLGRGESPFVRIFSRFPDQYLSEFYSPYWITLKSTFLFAWLLICLAFSFIIPGGIVRASESVSRHFFRTLVIGFITFAALSLAALLFIMLSVVIVGIPLLVALSLFSVVAVIIGTVSVFYSLGHLFADKSGRPQLSGMVKIILGLIAAGILLFIPFAGLIAWLLLYILGLGAAIATKLGSGKPWFASVKR